jgi:hypothetical protein
MFGPGHLAAHPLPPGIVGALGLAGYQLLGEVAGVGAGRLGAHGFLLVAADPDPALPDAGTQIVLHQPRLRSEADAAAYVGLAGQLGYLRLSGYRIAPERAGLRSQLRVIDPASGRIALTIPDRHPGRLFGAGLDVARLLAAARGLPPAGPPPDTGSPELLHQALLALALGDDALGGVEAVRVADRALELMQADAGLDVQAALAAAKASRLLPG